MLSNFAKWTALSIIPFSAFTCHTEARAQVYGLIQGGALNGQVDNGYWISTNIGQPDPIAPTEPPILNIGLKLAVVHGGSGPTALAWSLGASPFAPGPTGTCAIPGTFFPFDSSLGCGQTALQLSNIDTDPNDGWDVYLVSFVIPNKLIGSDNFLAIGGVTSNLGTRAFASRIDQMTLSFNGSAHYYAVNQAYPVEFFFSSSVPELSSQLQIIFGTLLIATSLKCRELRRLYINYAAQR